MNNEKRVHLLVNTVGLQDVLYWTNKKNIQEVIDDITTINKKILRLKYLLWHFQLYTSVVDWDKTIHSYAMQDMWKNLGYLLLSDLEYFERILDSSFYFEIFGSWETLNDYR